VRFVPGFEGWRRGSAGLIKGKESNRSLADFGLSLALVVMALAPSAARAEAIALAGHAMGTGWSARFIQPASPLDSEQVAREIGERLEHLEQLCSTYRSQSALSRFNATQETGWISVGPEMARVADESRQISALTSGAFDPTVYPLVQLWGFGSQRRSGTLPSAEEISAARGRVDWRQLEVQLSPPGLRKLQPSLAADFSSMAKGFAADAVSDLLVQLGAPNHLVQVGGDIKSAGAGAEGAGWRTAIEQPSEDTRKLGWVVVLKGQALSTSGNYRNFFRVGAERFGHILDPRTGRPADSELASVSVVHASCATSSALATALFVLGPEAGFRLAQQKGLACLFVVRNGAAFVTRSTDEFARYFQGEYR